MPVRGSEIRMGGVPRESEIFVKVGGMPTRERAMQGEWVECPGSRWNACKRRWNAYPRTWNVKTSGWNARVSERNNCRKHGMPT